MDTIVRSPKGSPRHTIPLSDVQIPDLWHIAQHLKRTGYHQSAAAVLECWTLCHDLLTNLKGDIQPPPGQEGP